MNFQNSGSHLGHTTIHIAAHAAVQEREFVRPRRPSHASLNEEAALRTAMRRSTPCTGNELENDSCISLRAIPSLILHTQSGSCARDLNHSVTLREHCSLCLSGFFLEAQKQRACQCESIRNGHSLQERRSSTEHQPLLLELLMP